MFVDMIRFNDGVGNGKSEHDSSFREREKAGAYIDRLFIARGEKSGREISFNLKSLVDNGVVQVGDDKIILEDGHILFEESLQDDLLSSQDRAYASAGVETKIPLMHFLATLKNPETNERVPGVSLDSSVVDAKTLSENIATYKSRSGNI